MYLAKQTDNIKHDTRQTDKIRNNKNKQHEVLSEKKHNK